MKTRYGLALMLVSVIMLAGCERSVKNMYDQPRDKAYSANPLFSDQASSRVPPAGSVPQSRGDVAGSSSGIRGEHTVEEDMRADAALSQPYSITRELLVRGRERYSIYCLPCHSPIGDGDGRVVRRGFPAPPSYHIERLREAPDRHFYDVITNGYGIMVSYADRVEPVDRWAIVAFIRALQLSQHARLSQLTPEMRAQVHAQLEKSPAGGSP